MRVYAIMGLCDHFCLHSTEDDTLAHYRNSCACAAVCAL